MNEPSSAHAPLEPTEIEFINAHGPYDHAKWVGRGVTVTSEETLAGRGELLAGIIRQSIMARYTLAEIATRSIADVGCYDGFVLHSLSDLPFSRLVGFEPRAKNITKGNIVRQVLGIETRCEFRQASIEDLSEEFDIVLCTGLIHHLSAPAAGIAKLRTICREFAFVETIALPDNLLSPEMRERMELKDLPYMFGESFVGFSGHKIESGYLDGSATSLSFVSLPSIATLRKYFSVSGFNNIQEPVAFQEYTSAILHGAHRRFSAVCLTAEAAATTDPDRTLCEWIANYETGMLCTLLPNDVAHELYELLALESDALPKSSLVRATVDYVRSDDRRALAVLATVAPDNFIFEILKNMKFNSADKAALELAKVRLYSGASIENADLLRTITLRLNADWRATFRAFALLAWCAEEAGDEVERDRYRVLCLSANPQFPRDLLLKGCEMLRRSDGV